MSQPFHKWKIPELKEELKSRNIVFNSRDSKETLLALLGVKTEEKKSKKEGTEKKSKKEGTEKKSKKEICEELKNLNIDFKSKDSKETLHSLLESKKKEKKKAEKEKKKEEKEKMKEGKEEKEEEKTEEENKKEEKKDENKKDEDKKEEKVVETDEVVLTSFIEGNFDRYDLEKAKESDNEEWDFDDIDDFYKFTSENVNKLSEGRRIVLLMMKRLIEKRMFILDKETMTINKAEGFCWSATGKFIITT
jgi:hypothetical protein